MEGTQVSHYRIGRMLGRGGMGEVYLAVDLTLDREVALKFVAAELTGDEDSVRRFEREARAAAALNHPNIATLYAFERDGARPFIAMELLTGRTLRDRIARGPFTVAEALALGRDVASALALAHRRGIVHRDIKPENLMYDEHGAVKITDFGLARAAQMSKLTRTGTTIGTAAYMGPEAIQGESSTPADVFALGVVIYEMLAGVTPWRGDNPFAMMFAISNEPHHPLTPARPDLPPEAVALVERMLARDPAARPESAEVHRALSRVTGAPIPAALAETLDPVEVENQPTLEITPGPGAAARRLAEQPTLEIVGRRGAAPGVRAVSEELPTERVGGGLAPAGEHGLARRRRLALPVPALVGAVIAVVIGVGIVWTGAGRRDAGGAARLNNEGLRALQAGDVEKARGLFTAALGRDHGNPAALMNLGTIWVRDGQPARAESAYFAALPRFVKGGQNEMAATVHVNLADMDLEAGNWEGAIEQLTRAAALDSSATVLNNLGYALAMGGRAAEARLLLTRAIARFPGQAPLLKNAALAEFTLGAIDAAHDSVARALAIDPTYTPAIELRDRILARLGGAPPSGGTP